MELENSNRKLKNFTKKNVNNFRKICKTNVLHFKLKYEKIDMKSHSILRLNRFEDWSKFYLGKLYLNDFQSELIQCKFKRLLTNGDSYEGDWLNGQLNGKGKYIWKDGAVYEGDWLNGKLVEYL